MLTKLSNSKFLIPVMAFLVILAMAAGFYISLKQSQKKNKQNLVAQGLFWPNPKKINDFGTIDHNGEIFDADKMRGKWSFIFFGYTNCPDVCPTTIYKLAEIKNVIKEKLPSTDFNTVLVTLDPDRDSAQRLDDLITPIFF